MITAREFVR